jgi:hypothetical protein
LRAQLTQIFKNLQSALEAAGGSCASIIKLGCFCCDRVPASELPIVREVRDQFIDTSAPPASTFVFVSRLVRAEWMIEVEAVAVVDQPAPPCACKRAPRRSSFSLYFGGDRHGHESISLRGTRATSVQVVAARGLHDRRPTDAQRQSRS